MVDSIDSIHSAQIQLAAAVDRTVNALRAALQQLESVAAATQGRMVDASTLQRKVEQFKEALSVLRNIATSEEDTAAKITRNVKP